ncbi:hypothetical protein [Massilia sp. CF038]|uniref:hypothetical protein n=1 Tax=Massilia sp. CF038 TaxID=1881045 RepID=UPI00090FD94C|nr:hypothetical protein [Massilia sp. CF038]SHH70168.1 hypothetical protein SAMN05428948_5015 [Massilia sp. CF038]
MLTVALMFLWLLAGGSCGVSIVYSRRNQAAGPPYTGAWLVYALAMLLCIGALGVIWEIEQLLGDSLIRNAASLTIFVAAFFTPIVLGYKRQQ